MPVRAHTPKQCVTRLSSHWRQCVFESTPAQTKSPTLLVHTRAPHTLKHSVECYFVVRDDGIGYASARPHTLEQCVKRLSSNWRQCACSKAHPRTQSHLLRDLKAQCRMRLCSQRRQRLCQCTPTHTKYATFKSLKVVHIQKHTRAHNLQWRTERLYTDNF